MQDLAEVPDSRWTEDEAFRRSKLRPVGKGTRNSCRHVSAGSSGPAQALGPGVGEGERATFKLLRLLVPII
jgi:hypothetical protein